MRLWPAALLALAIGCGTEAPRSAEERTDADGSQPPGLILVDSTTLAESDSQYIGKLGALAVAPNGDYLVADLLRARVMRYSPHGALVAVYGSPGSGPGELRTPSAIATNGDTLLLVADSREGKIELYDLASREPVGTVRLPGYVRRMTARHDTVWVGTRIGAQRKGMLLFTLQAPDELRAFLPYPAEFAQSRHLTGAYTVVAFGLWADTLFATFEGKGDWLVLSSTGQVRDTVEIPAVRRRGMPEDFAVRLAAARSQAEEFSLNSFPWSAHRLSSGEIALVYMDLTLESLNLTMDGFVSLLSADHRRACVDAPLPFSKDGQVRIAWVGDTLITGEQVVQGDRAITMVKRYTLSSAGCGWLGVE